LIIGVDFHSLFQQIAMVDTGSGELIERRLDHRNGEVQKFYAELPRPARVGMEATWLRNGSSERRTSTERFSDKPKHIFQVDESSDAVSDPTEPKRKP